MNKFAKMTIKLISVTQILAIALLAACTPGLSPTPAMPLATQQTRMKKSLSIALNW